MLGESRRSSRRLGPAARLRRRRIAEGWVLSRMKHSTAEQAVLLANPARPLRSGSARSCNPPPPPAAAPETNKPDDYLRITAASIRPPEETSSSGPRFGLRSRSFTCSLARSKSATTSHHHTTVHLPTTCLCAHNS